jgi:hypothetical protein
VSSEVTNLASADEGGAANPLGEAVEDRFARNARRPDCRSAAAGYSRPRSKASAAPATCKRNTRPGPRISRVKSGLKTPIVTLLSRRALRLP